VQNKQAFLAWKIKDVRRRGRGGRQQRRCRAKSFSGLASRTQQPALHTWDRLQMSPGPVTHQLPPAPAPKPPGLVSPTCPDRPCAPASPALQRMCGKPKLSKAERGAGQKAAPARARPWQSRAATNSPRNGCCSASLTRASLH
jgi:hypothetical protein